MLLESENNSKYYKQNSSESNNQSVAAYILMLILQGKYRLYEHKLKYINEFHPPYVQISQHILIIVAYM